MLHAEPKMKAWHFESKPDSQQVKDYTLLAASEGDVQKVLQYYLHHAVPGYEIKSIEVIYNPAMNRSFALNMQMLQARSGNSAFIPRWPQEIDAFWRTMIHQQWQVLSADYQDEDYPAVKIMPLWHGTKPAVLESIFKAGYANLASTDAGFYGKGLYSAYEAEYAYRVYSQGALILNWVAVYSAYPVIKSDMPELAGRGNYQNYDAHFIPVVPQDPSETIYRATIPGELHQYTEAVVFEKAQCLPRYLVILQPTLTKVPSKTRSNSQEVSQFLHLVAEGEQEKVEAMLQKNRYLVLFFGNVTDLSGRTFENITGFQYALWALDWHMWTILKKYLSNEKASKQLSVNGSWVKTYGLHAGVKGGPVDTLLKAYEEYQQNCSSWNFDLRENYWCKVVGGAQLLLPAHFINEYCCPISCFGFESSFLENTLHRSRIADDGEWFSASHNNGKLGETFAFYRWATVKSEFIQQGKVLLIGRVPQGAVVVATSGRYNIDEIRAGDEGRFFSLLLNVRSKQRETLFQQLVKNPFFVRSTLPQIGSSNILRFTPQSSSMAFSIKQGQIARLLRLVAEGEQRLAEVLLEQDDQLALRAGSLKDLSGRTFEGITALQYAVWSLDYHMWNMLLKYLPSEQAAIQLRTRGSWVDRYGLHAAELIDSPLKQLIIAFQIYIKNYDSWTTDQLKEYWQKKIGQAQLLLPAHVINEYCRTDRSFYPCPNFDEIVLPRARKIDEGEWFTTIYNEGTLGNKFGIIRASNSLAQAKTVSGWFGGPVATDYKAIFQLIKIRVYQLEQLFFELDVSHINRVKNSMKI